MREMKDSGVPWIGEIPKGWSTDKLKYHVRQRTDKSDTKEDYIALDNIESWSGRYLPTGFVPEGDTLLVRTGDILFGKLRPYLAKVYIAVDNACCSSEFVVLNSLDVNRSYLRYLLVNHMFIDEVNMSTYGTKMPRANPSFILNSIIPIPSVTEQCIIANFLDAKCAEIDSMLEQTRASIEEYKKLKQSLITEAVTKGIRGNRQMKDSGVEWIGDIPMEWSVSQVKHQFVLKTGTTPVGYDGTPSDRQLDWFTPSDILTEGCILDVAERKLNQSVILDSGIRLFPKGSILLVGIGATAGKVGYLQIEGYSNQQITALIPKTCFGKYYYYYFVKDRQRLLDNALFTTLPIINNSYLSSVLIVNPPISEQQEIAAYLDEKCAAIDSLIASKEALIAELEAYKKSLIYEYVTGKNEVLVQEGGVS